LNASVKTIVSGVMLPPEWLPTSSTGPSSGMFPSPRTSARNQTLESSHISGSRSRMKSGSRSSRLARGIRACAWVAISLTARASSDGLRAVASSPSATFTWPLRIGLPARSSCGIVRPV
jgi:hypothetical protein